MPRPRGLAVAWAAGAAVILSAPFVQVAFTELATRWPAQLRVIGIGASAVPAGAVALIALWRIRDRRPLRYGLLALGLGSGVAYLHVTGLTFPENVHCIEYGLLALLFYRAWRSLGDGAVLWLPLCAGTITGTLDEWFQWFIPIRAGEARDVLLNVLGSGCGLLFALGLDPPARITMALHAGSRARAIGWGTTALVVFVLFFHTVHVGHDVSDAELGSFRSRYTAAELAAAAHGRADRWRTRPPVVQRRLWREDQYLTEGLWHVQRRNQAWGDGDPTAAWRENRILEKFYAPILETPTYASAEGHRWPAAQRDAAAAQAAASMPSASDAYAYPLYVLPSLY